MSIEARTTMTMEKWRRKRSNFNAKLQVAALVLGLCMVLLWYHYAKPKSASLDEAAVEAGSREPEIWQCRGRSSSSSKWLTNNNMMDKFMWYAPHSGFSNQIGELRNAVIIAALLNRSLIIPPILDHHAVALGSCPKFNVQSAAQLSISVFDHILHLIRESRYISIGDIVDLSKITVKTIDFRVFASLWCGLDIGLGCSSCNGLRQWGTDQGASCKDLLTGVAASTSDCVYAVEDDCRTTVWTYKETPDNVLDKFQANDDLRHKKKINFLRRRRNIEVALGPGTAADSAPLLIFGSLFSAPYKGSQMLIDINTSRMAQDDRLRIMLQTVDFLPFTDEIVSAGKQYVKDRIQKPFVCAQLRLLDGQFKNHWKGTFSELQNKLKEFSGNIDIFVMTDLPESKWTGTYLGDLLADSSHYKLHMLKGNDSLLVHTAKRLMVKEYGLKSGYVPKLLKQDGVRKSHSSHTLPDIALYVEEAICSCASLGFVGTAGSTIAQNIENMRKNTVCS